MIGQRRRPFDTTEFLSTEGPGRRSFVATRQADFLFSGKSSRLCVISEWPGKAHRCLPEGPRNHGLRCCHRDFFLRGSQWPGGDSSNGLGLGRSVCMALRSRGRDASRPAFRNTVFSDFFMKFILARGIRTQANLVDQLFNSSERRLARTLLLMAEFGQAGEPEPLIPPITQETLAEILAPRGPAVSFS